MKPKLFLITYTLEGRYGKFYQIAHTKLDAKRRFRLDHSNIYKIIDIIKCGGKNE